MHTEVCGHINVQARKGYEYFITFIDDFSRYVYVYLMNRKFEYFEMFKEFKTEAERQLKKPLKILQSDCVGKHLSVEFKDFFLNRS